MHNGHAMFPQQTNNSPSCHHRRHPMTCRRGLTARWKFWWNVRGHAIRGKSKAEQQHSRWEPSGIPSLPSSLRRPPPPPWVGTLPGLERVTMVRPGYAIEYDYIPATQCDAALQTKTVGGLFLAGQVRRGTYRGGCLGWNLGDSGKSPGGSA